MSSTKGSRCNPSNRLTLDWTKAISKDNVEGHGKTRMASCESTSIVVPNTRFCTGSEYEGGCNQLGFSGFGIYKYPHGPIYRGEFKNGNFHGNGTISYPKGQQLLHGIWKKGKLLSFEYKFRDDLLFEEVEKYCKSPDRRFQYERLKGLNPAGIESLTNDDVPKELGENCYDTIEGYYDDSKLILYNNNHEIVRLATAEERREIKANYRYWKELPVGYKPSLYETWTTGKKTADENFDDYRPMELFIDSIDYS